MCVCVCVCVCVALGGIKKMSASVYCQHDTGVRLQLAVPPVQYERRVVEAGFCGGFVAQWFMTALVRHPGFESAVAGFRFFPFSPSRLNSN